MKVGRNDQCPCGSGKKHKHCCMDSVAKQHAEIFDDFAQTVAMSPDLTIEDLNVIAQHKMKARNNSPIDDFCGLSSTQMQNWLYAPFNELDGVAISVPQDLSASPVMRYLSLILDEIIKQDGAMKTTPKGNLPAKLVKQASDLLPEFPVAQYEKVRSISEYTGSNEDKFNALHYARVLAELTGIVYKRAGCLHMKKSAQKQYQTQGVEAFFLPMLETAVKKYSWSYLDSFSDDIDLQMFWLFMLWRLQAHGSLDELTNEVCTAFPVLLTQMQIGAYYSPQDQLAVMIETRFVKRFLQYWGFVTLDPRMFVDGVRVQRELTILPLLKQSFAFAR